TAISPILEGVENTNYRLETTAGRFVLTLFEKRTRAEDLPYCLGLMEHLASRGFPTPPPLRDRSGALVGELNGRPAAVVAWAEGAWRRERTPAEAHAAGRVLAELHLAGEGFDIRRADAMGFPAWAPLADRCRECAHGEDARMLAVLDAEIARLA